MELASKKAWFSKAPGFPLVGKSRSGPDLMVTISGSSSSTTPPGLVRLWNPEAAAGTLVAKPE